MSEHGGNAVVHQPESGRSELDREDRKRYGNCRHSLRESDSVGCERFQASRLDCAQYTVSNSIAGVAPFLQNQSSTPTERTPLDTLSYCQYCAWEAIPGCWRTPEVQPCEGRNIGPRVLLRPSLKLLCNNVLWRLSPANEPLSSKGGREPCCVDATEVLESPRRQRRTPHSSGCFPVLMPGGARFFRWG